MELARTASVKERQRVALLLAETERLERDAQQAEAELLQVQQEIAQLAVARQTPLPLWHYCSAGHFCAPVDLPADLVAAAEAKLGETPQRRLEALATLRQRCDEATLKSGLEFVRSDDQFLVAFLRAKQFDVTRAFECILKYIELVAEVADEDASLRRDGGLSHSEMGQLYALKILELLPRTAVDGSRIALVRGALFTDEMLATLSAAPDGGRAGDRPLRFLLWLFTRLISDPYVAVNGLTMVEDLADMPLMACVRFARSLDKGPKRRMMRYVNMQCEQPDRRSIGRSTRNNTQMIT
jgi:DNA-directed RNA polymerase subunit F